jgi:hypothetical protein
MATVVVCSSVSLCYGGSWIWSGGGGGKMGSVLDWCIELFGIGYVICGKGEGYVS